MSEKLGPLQFGKKQELVFLGREIAEQKDYSERTAETIDDEVHSLVQGAYDRAKKLLSDNIDKLHALAGALLEREILDRDDIENILSGRPMAPMPVDDPLPEPGLKPAEPINVSETSARAPSLSKPAPGGATP
jgi:cell division protease FtsH